jgi:hypothetical protein
MTHLEKKEKKREAMTMCFYYAGSRNTEPGMLIDPSKEVK